VQRSVYSLTRDNSSSQYESSITNTSTVLAHKYPIQNYIKKSVTPVNDRNSEQHCIILLGCYKGKGATLELNYGEGEETLFTSLWE